MVTTPQILPKNDRALKEWAVVCEALRRGLQTIIIRKGGIREEDGIFRVSDSEFFLLPTYEHQNADLLRAEYRREFADSLAQHHNPCCITVDAYAVVDSVMTVHNERSLRNLVSEHIWNEDYIKIRLGFNPYDPLYVILLRVFNLPASVTLPMRPDYEGCKSWVTLAQPVVTDGAIPAIPDSDFGAVGARIRAALAE